MKGKKAKREDVDIIYRATAEPKAMADDIPVYCSHDELLPLAKIIPNPKNPNDHPKEQVKLLSEIINAQGWRAPITISTRSGFIVAGHGRLEAAYAMGASVAPVDYQNFASEAEEYAVLVADNRLAELSEINDAKLAGILSEIADTDVDLLLTGYDEEDFADLLLELQEEEEEAEIPEEEFEPTIEVTPRTRPGDIYLLGNHRLMCGDSTNDIDVERLMDGHRCDIAFTSPPYNVGKTPFDKSIGKTSKYNEKSDEKAPDAYINLLLSFTRLSLKYSDYSFVNVQSVAGNKVELIEYLYEMRHNYADSIIWDKCNAEPAMNENVLNSVWEYVHVFSHEAKRLIGTKRFRGTLQNIIHVKKQTRENKFADIHNATFPLEFAIWFCDNFATDSVLELFCGTGTTMIACESLGKQCYAMENEPLYCDVIVNRYIEFVGTDENVYLLDGDKKMHISELREREE